MNVKNNKYQKEWHDATKPLKRYFAHLSLVMVSVETLFNIAYKKYVLVMFASADLKFVSENVGNIYQAHLYSDEFV